MCVLTHRMNCQAASGSIFRVILGDRVSSTLPVIVICSGSADSSVSPSEEAFPLWAAGMFIWGRANSSSNLDLQGLPWVPGWGESALHASVSLIISYIWLYTSLYFIKEKTESQRLNNLFIVKRLITIKQVFESNFISESFSTVLSQLQHLVREPSTKMLVFEKNCFEFLILFLILFTYLFNIISVNSVACENYAVY